jgi:SAM-dependent methyltransferase
LRRVPQFNYAKEFGSVYHAGRRLPAGTEHWLAELRAEKLRRWIAPTDRVLEYGVGFGWNLAVVHSAEKVGFDLTAELQEAVEAKGIRFESDEACLPQQSFNAVLLHHVLEHIENPFFCLCKIKSLLVPGGRLLLFVPFERERKYRRFRPTDRAHHLYSWTPSSIAQLLVRAGFAIEEKQMLRFRFDRLAAVIAKNLGGGLRLYRLLRGLGVSLLPEYELGFVGRT